MSSLGTEPPNGAGARLKRRVLLPLALALAFLVLAFAYATHRSEQNFAVEIAASGLENARKALDKSLEARGNRLRVALQLLDRDPLLRTMLASGDRGRIGAAYAGLFERLRREFGISHFYWIAPDRTILLRLHEPERFGDRLERLTLDAAGRTGRSAVGMEFGTAGTLSLRAVMPVRQGERLLGYVELAEEVQDMVQDVIRLSGSEGIVLIHKAGLSRPDWESGMRMLGRQPDWERLSSAVVSYSTLPKLPAGIERLLPEGAHLGLAPAGEATLDGRIFKAGFIPLRDAGGREVGDLVILHDVTATSEHMMRTLAMGAAAAAFVGALLFWLFYAILERIQRELADSRERLIEEAESHVRLQQQRIAELTAWVEERKRTDEELRIAASAFESQEGMFVTAPDGVILRVNQAFTALTGYAAEEAVGRDTSLLKSGRHDAAFYRQMWEALERERYWQGEIWNRRKDGSVFPAWQTISAVADAEGRVSHFVSAFSDATRYKRAEAEIERLAYYDQLTRLPNRRLLLDRLGQALAASALDGRHGALLFIDLDNFMVLNDTSGHRIGDRLLTEVAQRLRVCVREGDTVARLGGDEFVVMLQGLDKDRGVAATQAEAAGEKIRGAFGRPFVLGDAGQGVGATPYQCTASIGADLFSGHRLSVEDLLKHAEVAMYQAKSAGRNAIHFFDPAMQASLEARAGLEADLRSALSGGQFELHYQPQVARDGAVVGAEALLRWRHPVRGMVSPAEYIPLAEDTGLILPIGRWVLETACERLRRWQESEATRGLQIAINVSARQFGQPDFVETVRTALERSGVPPDRLKLELTESLVLDDVDSTIDKMNALKAQGVGFSMDDFGTGYSSLSYVKRLPLDQLKIDQSFVRDITTDPGDAVIVSAIIGMAASFGLTVIAEGVETPEQQDFLARHGCAVFQGALFSRPLPPDAFDAFLARDRATAG